MMKFCFSVVVALFGVLGSHVLHAESLAADSVKVLDWDIQNKRFELKSYPIDELGLLNRIYFGSESFTLYNGFSSRPLEFDPNNYRAVQVQYHLNKAQRYFRSMAASLGLAQDITVMEPPTKIRLQVKYAYSPKTYIDMGTREWNMARTIPASDPEVAKEYIAKYGQGWGQEIWFSPILFIPLITLYMPDPVIDTALCPDVVYHEYTHLMTGQFIGKNAIGRSLSEGLSDYFSASLIDSPLLYSAKTCKHRAFQFFDQGMKLGGKKYVQYSPELEGQYDKEFLFIPSMLWSMRQRLGASLTDRVVLKAVSKVRAISLIYPDFIQALVDSMAEILGTTDGTRVAERIEKEVFLPRGVHSSLSANRSVFAGFGAADIQTHNTDAEHLEKGRSVCQTQDEWKVHLSMFKKNRRVVYLSWFCDGYRVPFVLNLSQASPASLLVHKSENVSVVAGRLDLASRNLQVPDAKFAQILSYATKYFTGKTESVPATLSFNGGAQQYTIHAESYSLDSKRLRLQWSY